LLHELAPAVNVVGLLVKLRHALPAVYQYPEFTAAGSANGRRRKRTLSVTLTHCHASRKRGIHYLRTAGDDWIVAFAVDYSGVDSGLRDDL
jgi:hypothetical protein